MAWTVHNPTTKKKAVRAAGGLPVIAPGETAEFAEAWSAEYVSHLRTCGLELTEVDPELSEPEPEPEPEHFTREQIEVLDDKDKIIGLIEAHGVDPDGRWGVDRLRDQLLEIMFVNI